MLLVAKEREKSSSDARSIWNFPGQWPHSMTLCALDQSQQIKLRDATWSPVQHFMAMINRIHGNCTKLTSHLAIMVLSVLLRANFARPFVELDLSK